MEREDLCLEKNCNARTQLADLLNSECRSAAGGDVCKTVARCLSHPFLSSPVLLADQLDLEGSMLCLIQQRSLADSCPHQLPLRYIKQKWVCFGFVGVQACSAQASFQDSLLRPSQPFLVQEPGVRPFATSTPVRMLAAVSKRSPHPVPTQEQFLPWQRRL